MKYLGRHLIVEFYNCDGNFLNDIKKIKEILIGGAKYAKATIIKVVFHKFSPYGVTGIIIIAESHISLHTWPEYSFASIDIYTCGSKVNPWKAYQFYKKYFKPKTVSVLEMKRGILNIPYLKHKPTKF